MYRPVKKGKSGRFESLTPDIDREVAVRMDRQAVRMSKMSERCKLISHLQAENARDEEANAIDREACRQLELRKAQYQKAVASRKVIPVDFSPPQNNKPPKKAA